MIDVSSPQHSHRHDFVTLVPKGEASRARIFTSFSFEIIGVDSWKSLQAWLSAICLLQMSSILFLSWAGWAGRVPAVACHKACISSVSSRT